MFNRIGHIALRVRNMEETLAFYCDILGAEVAFEMRDRDSNPWIIYVKVHDGQFIEFYYGGKTEPSTVRDATGLVHFCLEVDDIHETAARIKANGGVLESEPIQGVSKNYLFFVKDPDGNMIEIMELHPDSPHLTYESKKRSSSTEL